MKRIIHTAVLVIALASLVAAQGSQPGTKSTKSLEQELFAMDKRAYDAWNRKDVKFFEGFLAPEFISPGPTATTKQAVIKNMLKPNSCVTKSMEFDDSRLRMLDNTTAILTYRIKQDVTCGGKPEPKAVDIATVFVKRGGKWLSAFHSSSPASD